jgi:hypothetical protein
LVERCHWYVYEVAAGLQVPEPALSRLPTRSLPVIVGVAMLNGEPDATGPSAAEAAVPCPLPLLAVTTTRRLAPTSAASSE